MRCLITGATGHIGSYLTRLLIKQGEEVSIIARPTSSLWRLEGLEKKIKILQGSLEEVSNLKQKIIDFNPDVVFHLAWFGVTSDHRNDTAQLFTNVIGSLNFFKIVQQSACKTFIGLGSQAEYGPYSSLLNESLPVNPLTSYGIAKLSTGILIKKLCELTNIRYVWIRLLATYGPKDDEKHLIPSVINKLLRSEKPLLTPAEQKWDYLYVEDAAEALYEFALKESTRGVYNLGSGSSISIRQIVEYIRDLINPDLPIGFGELSYRDDQVMFLGTSIEKAMREITWKPKTLLKEGLECTIRWHKENLSNFP